MKDATSNKEQLKTSQVKTEEQAPEQQDPSASPEDSFQFIASSIEIPAPKNNNTYESFVSALTVTSSSFTADFPSASQAMMMSMMPLDESAKEGEDGDSPTHSSKQSIGSMTMRMMMEELPPGMTSAEIDTTSVQKESPLPNQSPTPEMKTGE